MMRSFLNKLKLWYINLKLRNKILLLGGSFITIALIINTAIYSVVIYNESMRQMGEATRQSLSSARSALDARISTVNHASRLIMSKNLLTTDDASQTYYEKIAALDKAVRPIIDIFPFVQSVYVYGDNGFDYSLSKNTSHLVPNCTIEEAPWYALVLEKRGNYILRHNSGGFFQNLKQDNYISFIRSVNDLTTQKHIGTLIINIDSAYLLGETSNTDFTGQGSSLLLLGETGDLIGSTNSRLKIQGDILENFRKNLEEQNGMYIEDTSIDRINYRVAGIQISEYGWSLVLLNSINSFLEAFNWINFVAAAILIISSFIFGTSILVVSRQITHPIYELITSMKEIKNYKFNKVAIEPGRNDEIGRLKANYNLMIDEIESLIEKVIQEQKTKRNAELSLLHEQIKPHFLYNTIDAICYFALIGDNTTVYNSLETLGSYFRNVLSGGNEQIPLRNEIAIIKSFLALQKLRYGDIFVESYEVDSDMLDHPVLKLMIQPLVENALYHGVRYKKGDGVIRISVHRNGDQTRITVEDNGSGMTAEQISVLFFPQKTELTGFGLAGTLERIKMYYQLEEKNFFTISSKKDLGTKIEIAIPYLPERSKYDG